MSTLPAAVNSSKCRYIHSYSEVQTSWLSSQVANANANKQESKALLVS